MTKPSILDIGLACCLLAIVLASCAPQAVQSFPPEASEAIEAARSALVGQLDTPIDELEVVEVRRVEWDNACLELGDPDEACAQVITPGWLINLRAGEREYEVHTDQTGSQVRIKSLEMGNISSDAAIEAQRFLAEELGAPVEELELISSERREWSDTCLGLGAPEESCGQMITPGWRIIISFDGSQYEVRTDELGEQIRINS